MGHRRNIVFADGVGLFTIDADGGPAQLLARPAAERGEVRYAWPNILPGRRVALFTILRDTIANAEIALIDLDTKQQKVLLRGGHAARYVATGHVIYAAGGRLHGVSLDLASLAVGGKPFALESIQVAETFGPATANFDVSQTGTLVYVAPTRQRLRTLVWVDRKGREQPVRCGRRLLLLSSNLAGRHPGGARRRRRESRYLGLEPRTRGHDPDHRRSDRGHDAGMER